MGTYLEDGSRYDSSPTFGQVKTGVTSSTPGAGFIKSGQFFYTGSNVLRINVGTDSAPVYKTITTS